MMNNMRDRKRKDTGETSSIAGEYDLPPRMRSKVLYGRIKLLSVVTIVFIVSYFYLSYFRNHFYALLADEGYIFYEAKRILAGQIIYKDFFQLLPPGDFYLLALIFKVFGTSYAVGMETAVIMQSMVNTLLFYLGYKAIKSWHAILLPLFFPIPGFLNFMQYSHYWSSMLFLFIALSFYLGYLEQNRKIYLYATGFFIGITGLFLQTTGVYATLLLLLVFVLEDKNKAGFAKKLILFVFSISLPLIITFGYITWKGALFDFIKEQYLAISIYAEAGTFNPIQLYFSRLGYAMFPYGLLFISFSSIAVIAGIILILFRNRISNSTKIIFAGDIVQTLTSSSRMDSDHILMNCAMALVILLLFVKWMVGNADRLSRVLHRLLKYAFDVATVAGVAWCLLIMYTNIVNRYEQAYSIDMNGTRLWTYNKQQVWEINEFFPKVESILQGKKNVFVYPYCPLVYFIYKFNNPTFTDFFLTTWGVPDYGEYSFNRAIQDLIRHKTQYIVYCDWPHNYLNHILALENKQYHVNILDKFISDNYTSILNVNDLVLYKKR